MVSRCLFDVRVFTPIHLVIATQPFHPSIDQCHEQKKREFGDQVLEIEKASFTQFLRPLGVGVSRESTVFYR